MSCKICGKEGYMHLFGVGSGYGFHKYKLDVEKHLRIAKFKQWEKVKE